MSDSIENQRSEWRDIIKLYEFFTESDNPYQPVLELVRWLADSPYASRISASTSLARLNISAQKISRRGQWQGAQISCWRGEFTVEFHKYEATGDHSKLSRLYAHDEIRPAIESWLWRLQMEAEIYRQQ